MLNKKANNTRKSTEMDIVTKSVIKIQSAFRAYLLRKAYQAIVFEHVSHKQIFFYRLLQNKRKYFTSNEFWETISRTKIYNPNETREVREYSYQCNGGKYYGEWRGGLRDGYGVMKWPDGASYEGEWKDNHAHGKGKFIHVIGDIYDGDWVRDKACGRGVYKSVHSGGTYVGEWYNDLQHGKGVENW